jgi:hypothetical protein
VPAVAAEQAPPQSPRLSTPAAGELQSKIVSYFQGQIGQRVYLQVDKPMYKPGETLWVKTWDLRARDLAGGGAGTPDRSEALHELVSPKGAVVLKKRVALERGIGLTDFELPEDVQGGEYTLRVQTPGGTAERPIIVNSYEAPRAKKKLEFVRKAYGARDEVTATIEVQRATGEALRNQPLVCAVRLDGQDLPRVKLTTDGEGRGLVRFSLPGEIALGDGLLTVMVEDGGITESISKRIPIVVKKLAFALFPEGGQLVQGLPGRLYFEAKTPLGKPADVAGRIVDDLGNAVTSFESYRDGLGRIPFTPATGRSYHAEITKPVGVSEQYSLPLAATDGCTLSSFDDLDGELAPLRVAVRCSEKRKVTVVGMLRENLIDAATVEVPASGQAVVYLQAKDAAVASAQGVARVTVFGAQNEPLAERLVFRNRRARLGVKVVSKKPTYTPREQVTLTVTTTTPNGTPRPAEVALAVVDDTVVSYADDKTGHLLSRLLLEPEIPGKVEEPNFYFDLTEAKSALAMDLLMGTRGYRKFVWSEVLNPLPRELEKAQGATGGLAGLLGRGYKASGVVGARNSPPPPAAMAPPARPAAAPAPVMAKTAPVLAAPKPAVGKDERAKAPAGDALARRDVAERKQAIGNELRVGGLKEVNAVLAAHGTRVAQEPAALAAKPEAQPDNDGLIDRDWAPAKKLQAAAALPIAPVRVFPAPTYDAEYAGPRTDFRETVFWQPQVKTGKDGTATVTFYMSDAITSFRVVTEGIGGGWAGRDETVIQSKLPFSMEVKLPLEVSAGDRILMPLLLTNERDSALDVAIDTSFGELLQLDQSPRQSRPRLAAHQRDSHYYALHVVGQEGKTPVRFTAQAGGLRDEFVRDLLVAPVGYPQLWSKSGEVRGTITHELNLTGAVAGTISAHVRLDPSPVATMVTGLEGMLREPVGCFEQTSSSNYPNVMVLQYLKQHKVEEPKLIERSNKLMEAGYRKLTGFESPSKGYEWFGGDPGHEALTAYGLVEFADMKDVYGEVDRQMVDRTAAWLKSRRDGKGGYLRDAKAIDSFGRASPQVTDAYITYSLSEAGTSDIEPELRAQVRLGHETEDAYLLGLAANTLLNVARYRDAGQSAAARLATLQSPDGSFTHADHSITRSGGTNLYVETTALAVMAFVKSAQHPAELRRAVEWLHGNRSGFGQWGATQATVLALKALTQYDASQRRTQGAGTVSLLVNGRPAGKLAYQAGRNEPLEFKDIQNLRPGKNTITVVHAGSNAMPYTVAVEYRSAQPATSEHATVDLRTTLERRELKMGETVRLSATISNKTTQGQPMTVARIGLPGGLTYQVWQLKELREKGLVAFTETRAREVILYFRELQPSETKTIPIELVATVPGSYTGPASSAYLYYTDEHKSWAEALTAQIAP